VTCGVTTSSQQKKKKASIVGRGVNQAGRRYGSEGIGDHVVVVNDAIEGGE